MTLFLSGSKDQHQYGTYIGPNETTGTPSRTVYVLCSHMDLLGQRREVERLRPLIDYGELQIVGTGRCC